MEKYSKTYTQLANIILGLSDYQRSEILGIIHKFLRNQSSTPYYKRRRSNKSAALISIGVQFPAACCDRMNYTFTIPRGLPRGDSLTMFILGFMGGIVFWFFTQMNAAISAMVDQLSHDRGSGYGFLLI